MRVLSELQLLSRAGPQTPVYVLFPHHDVDLHLSIMAKLEVLTFSSLVGLINARGAYLLGYSWLFGMCEFIVVS